MRGYYLMTKAMLNSVILLVMKLKQFYPVFIKVWCPHHKDKMVLLQATLMNTNIKCYVDSVPPYRDICKLEFCLEYQ